MMRQVADAQFKDQILVTAPEGLRTSHGFHILNCASFSCCNIQSGPSILVSHGFTMKSMDAKAFECNVGHMAVKKIHQFIDLGSLDLETFIDWRIVMC
jgi:hypothetical protein